MGQSVRETIKKLTKAHLSSGNMLFGQCLTAVGWVGGTIPSDSPNLVELSMADVMAGGIVVGAALMGQRPIYVVRYQGFQWFNAPIICNYAGKSKRLWDISCPIFIRSIAMEGGIGPVAGSSHHGIYARMPGIKICSPMTPSEYIGVYDTFMKHDDPMYVSEHRKSYDNDLDFLDICHDNAHFSLFPFSVCRFEAVKAAEQLLSEGIKVNVFHQVWINPLQFSRQSLFALRYSKYGGMVLDDDYPNGIAKQAAYELMIQTGKTVTAHGIREDVAGFQPSYDNIPLSASEICYLIKNRIHK